MSRTSRALLLLLALLAPLLPLAVPSASAAPCTNLAGADLNASAPHLTGMLQSGATACATIDATAGTKLLLGATDRSNIYMQLFASPLGSSGPICAGFGSTTCVLRGSGPYLLQIADVRRSQKTAYDVQAVLVDGDLGCIPADLATYGPTNDAVSVRPGSNQYQCFSYAASAGASLMVRSRQTVPTGTADMVWSLLNPDGSTLCDSVDREYRPCTAQVAGRYSLLVVGQNQRYDGLVQQHQAAVLDVSRTDGCAQGSASWYSPRTPMQDDLELRTNCLNLDDAVAGERLIKQGEGAGIIVDAHGQYACAPERQVPDRWLEPVGCLLSGDAPFRIVSFKTYFSVRGASYDLAGRVIGPGTDCPLVQPTSFGSTPDAEIRGIGCRQLDVAPDHTLSVRASEPDGAAGSWSTLINGDFEIVCDQQNDDTCTFHQPQRVTILVAETATVGIYDHSSTAGCLPVQWGVDGEHTDTGPAEVECRTLDLPAGSAVAGFGPGEDGAEASQFRFVDSSGATVCAPSSGTRRTCELTGTGPYRALFDPDRDGATTFALVRGGQDNHCPTLQLGARQGSSRDVDPGAVVTCVHVPGEGRTAGEGVYVRPSVQVENLVIEAIGTDGLATCSSRPVDSLPFKLVRGCGPETDGVGYDVFIAGESPEVFDIARADVASRLVNFRAPSVAGDVRVARTVRARIGDWSEPYNLHTRYQWLLDGRPVRGATSASWRIPTSAAGRLVSVRLTCTADRRTDNPPKNLTRSAVSTTVRVKR